MLKNEIVTMISTICTGANPQKLLDTPIAVTVDIARQGNRGVSCPYSASLPIPDSIEQVQIRSRNKLCHVKGVIIICLGEGSGIAPSPSFRVSSFGDSQSFLKEVNNKCHLCIQKYPD